MSHQNKISPFCLQILKIIKPKYVNVSPDDPSLPDRVKLLIKTEFVTQIRFTKKTDFTNTLLNLSTLKALILGY